MIVLTCLLVLLLLAGALGVAGELVPRPSGSRDLVESRWFRDVNSPAKASIISRMAQDLGLALVFVASHLAFIGGKPSMTGLMLAALLKRSKNYRYITHEKTAKVCKIEFLERVGDAWERIGIETYTMEMAQRAGLVSNPSWKKFPEQMLFWRALSAGARCYCPDALAGGPAHLIEELRPNAEYDVDGVPVRASDVQDAEVVEPTEQHKQIEQLLADTGTDHERFLAHYGAASITSLDADACTQALATLTAKKQAQNL